MSGDLTRFVQHPHSRRGVPVRVPKPCGTYAAYRRHQRNGEPVDAACRAAYNGHQREMYRRRRGVA
jgi:hypothetical protein